MPFTSFNQQSQSSEGKKSRSTDLLTPSSPGNLPSWSCPLKAALYQASYQPSDASSPNTFTICTTKTLYSGCRSGIFYMLDVRWWFKNKVPKVSKCICCLWLSRTKHQDVKLTSHKFLLQKYKMNSSRSDFILPIVLSLCVLTAIFQNQLACVYWSKGWWRWCRQLEL